MTKQYRIIDGKMEEYEGNISDDNKYHPVLLPTPETLSKLDNWRQTVSNIEIAAGSLQNEPLHIRQMYALVQYIKLEIDTMLTGVK